MINPLYKQPTEAQKLADLALQKLNELEIECSCEYGECPEEYHFGLMLPTDDGMEIKYFPSYIPVTKTCRKCELRNILVGISDPDDLAGVYT